MKASNRFVWFRLWIIGRHTLKQISDKSGYSERSLKRYFYQYLRKAPLIHIKPSEKVNLLIDGTYFSNNLCLILYRDNTVKYTQLSEGLFGRLNICFTVQKYRRYKSLKIRDPFCFNVFIYFPFFIYFFKVGIEV